MRFEHHTTLNLARMMGALQGFLNDELMCVVEGVYANRDVSEDFVNYFRTGHERLHEILGTEYCCEKINHLLHDLFLMHAKYHRQLEDYAKLHPIFRNFMAVHVYNDHREQIATLHEEGLSKNDLVNTLAYESHLKHEKGECRCGSKPQYNKMLDLFMQCVSYFHLTHDPNIGMELDFVQNWTPEANLLN